LTDESRQPDRILLVRPSALGDVCRTVPVLVSLRRAFPDATIDWVVRDSFVDAVRAHPDLSEVIAFPRKRFADMWKSARVLREFRDWIGEVRRRQYDVAYDLQGLGRSALITYMSGAVRRVGYTNAREFAWMGYNVRHDPPRSTHIVDQMLELLERESIPAHRDLRLYVPQEDAEWWRAHDARRPAHAAYTVLAPTSRHASKRWPMERWVELIPHLLQRNLGPCVLIGAPNEIEQVTPLLSAVTGRGDVISLVGTATIGQTMAALHGASLVIANDSAPLHMAVGFDRPLIALFGPTDPEFVGPYGRQNSILRAYDQGANGRVNYRDSGIGDALMRRISVEMVVQRIDEMPRATPSSTRQGREQEAAR